jgi:hypothetical protein
MVTEVPTLPLWEILHALYKAAHDVTPGLVRLICAGARRTRPNQHYKVSETFGRALRFHASNYMARERGLPFTDLSRAQTVSVEHAGARRPTRGRM